MLIIRVFSRNCSLHFYIQLLNKYHLENQLKLIRIVQNVNSKWERKVTFHEKKKKKQTVNFRKNFRIPLSETDVLAVSIVTLRVTDGSQSCSKSGVGKLLTACFCKFYCNSIMFFCLCIVYNFRVTRVPLTWNT